MLCDGEFLSIKVSINRSTSDVETVNRLPTVYIFVTELNPLSVLIFNWNDEVKLGTFSVIKISLCVCLLGKK